MYDLQILELFRKSWIPDTWKYIRFPFFPVFSVMTAAGSLFTSCIEQVEPEGIRDMRIAKAEYIRSLKDVNAADAEYKRAEADVQRALARYQDAQTAIANEKANYEKLMNEYQQLLNEAQAAKNEADAAKYADELARLERERKAAERQAELEEIEHKQAVAEALENLRKAQRDIELKAQDLTQAEKETLISAAGAYYATVAAAAKLNMEIAALKAEIDYYTAEAEKEEKKDSQIWDKESSVYVSVIEYHEKQIAKATEKIAELEAELENVPTIDDIEAWAAEVQGYKDAIEKLQFDAKDILLEKADYFVKYIHDGVKAFNDVIDTFVAEYAAYKNVDEDDIKAKSEIVDKGAPKQEDYTMGNAPVIEFPTLSIPNENPIFARFVHLLNSYENVYFPIGSETKVIDTDGKLTISANQEMKEFILGTDDAEDLTVKLIKEIEEKEDGTLDTLYFDEMKAKYGLKGALAVFDRDSVNFGSQKPDIDADKKAAADAKTKWSNYKDTLVTGLKEYKFYKEALEAYNDAAPALAENKEALVDAIEDLISVFNEFSNAKVITFRPSDSTMLFNALKAYAVAREGYLDDPYDKTSPVKYSYNSFLCAPTTKGGQAVVDTIAYKDMTFANLADYKFAGVKGLAENIGDEISLGNWGGFAAIMEQLLGKADALKVAPIEKIDESYFANIFGTYKYVAAKDKDGDTPAQPAKFEKGTADYTPKAMTTAEGNVKSAAKKFFNIYSTFWKTDVDTTAAMKAYDNYFSGVKDATLAKAEKAVNDELKNKINYSENTFTSKFNVVNFDEAGNVIYTEALGVILSSVENIEDKDKKDPEYYKGDGNIVINSKVLAKGGLFYNWMMAEWKVRYDEAYENQDLETIKAWVAEVEAAFEKDVEDAQKPDVDAYKEAVKNYNEALKIVNGYEDYYAALVALVGEKVNEEGDTVVMVAHKDLATLKIDKYMDENDWIVTFKQDYIEKSAIGIYTGEWNTEIVGGQIFANLDEIFPELPATAKKLKEAEESVADDIAHYQILKEAAEQAYLHAARVAGYTEELSDASWEALVSSYEQAQITYGAQINGQIEYYKGKIDYAKHMIADYTDPISELRITIAELEAQVAAKDLTLKAVNKAQELAKANYDKVLDYIKAQDFGFIDLTDIFEVVSSMMGKLPDSVVAQLKSMLAGYLN